MQAQFRLRVEEAVFLPIINHKGKSVYPLVAFYILHCCFGAVELQKSNSPHSRIVLLLSKWVAFDGENCYNNGMENQNDNKIVNADQLKGIIAKNLSRFRKAAGITQQQLAQQINYSDKAVSKWERGEGIPDVVVLKTLADMYGVTVNDFLVEHKEQPLGKSSLKTLIAKRWLVALLSAGLVWLVATVVTVVWLFVDKTVPVAKYAYICALPVSLTVLLVFSCLWCKLWERCVVASLLMWSLCLLIHIFLNFSNAWLIYIIGAAVQLLIILWYLLRFFVLKDKNRQ